MWVSPDNKIHKLVVLEGDWGKKPLEQSECLVSITDCLNLAEYNNSTIVIGDSDNYLRRMLDKCLITMNVNEVAKFTILPENISFTIKLEQMIFHGYIHQWDARKKMEIALNHKQKGVELFKQNRGIDATYRFTRGLKIISSIPIDAEISPEEIDNVTIAEINVLKANLFNNLASFYLKNEAWSLTIDMCRKVFMYDQNNVKAHYKIAVAFIKDRNFEEAQKELEVVLNLEPDNKAAGEQLKHVKQEIKQANQQFDSLVTKMFK